MRTRPFILTLLIGLFLILLIPVPVRALTEVATASTTVSATVASLPSIDQGGGGGSIRSGVRFSGQAYPGATITLLRSAQPISTVIANDLGSFTFTFTDVKDAQQLFFSMYATDVNARRSTLLNFPVVFYTGRLTDVTGIRFAPTIATDKVAVKQNDFLTVTGAALPGLPMNILIEGPAERTFGVSASEGGTYRLIAPLTYQPGDYLVRAKYEGDTRTSTALRVIIGAASIPRVEVSANIPGDCNVDQKVTITDFSVLAYWFGKKNPPVCVDTNKDGVINLIDFSILAYYWQG